MLLETQNRQGFGLADDIKLIESHGKILAVLIRRGFENQGMDFFTPLGSAQQLAQVSHRKGKVIEAHIHNPVKREVVGTQEVLFIKKGKLAVDLYREDQELIESIIVQEGDVILFSEGGHGYRVLEDVELVLVKQGPYAGEVDKTYIGAKGPSNGKEQ